MNKEELNNLKAGECFTIGSRKFKIIKNDFCSKCDFHGKDCELFRTYNLMPECAGPVREDGTNVVFKEVENESME